ncbi:hypothetical protein CMV_006345 [Castanea mollissima]|uniref:Uncharacterized protein n=1 Tax=Castanea mollissima TaxID=60419 RepID=A0A8J4RHA2_9ROSI|nr:hypothetical protein CMV_006345 [Castanea mollissima]
MMILSNGSGKTVFRKFQNFIFQKENCGTVHAATIQVSHLILSLSLSLLNLLRTDKWAETIFATKWGHKWEDKFFAGIGSRQGETWHVTPGGERWSRTWGEEHFGNGKVHKYGKSTTGESWDIVVDEETYYEAEPHYGWADVVGDSSQLLSIELRERPPGVYPNLDFGSSPPPPSDDSPEDLPPSR